MSPCLNLLYVHGPQIGYGRYGTHLALELDKLGVTVFDVLDGPDVDPDRKRNWADGNRAGAAQIACWVSTPSHARGWWKGQVPIISTMWESGSLPPSFTENLHEFETVIVPSHQNVELFSRFHDDVRFLPLGVDPAVWGYTPRKDPDLFFDFLIGGSGERKGTMLAHDAFVKVFGDDRWEHGDGPIPRLIMKSPRGEEPITHHRVRMISGRLTAQEEVDLYATAHVGLAPSRGEGFGLQPLQMIAQGLPTILTAAHGHDSFAHLGWGLSSTLTKAAYFIYGDAGEWWEPDFDELCQHMEWMYDNWGQACARAAQSAKVVAAEFTWRKCAEGFLDIVGRDRLTGFTPTEWYEPVSKLYEVITDQDRMLDVGGTMRIYRRGESYWEPADVKRVAFDCGWLDPACLQGDDIGLHPDQLGKVEEYSAAHSYCPTCTQRLGTHPTRSDDLYAELPRLHAV
jgi:glycosyltransferase involved in cell wall biosynthesis